MTLDIAQSFREKYPLRTIKTDLLEHTILADRTMMDIVISNLIDNKPSARDELRLA